MAAPDEVGVLAALAGGPKASHELGASAEYLQALAALGHVTIDPDPWPDEYVPGNPLVVRLPDDQRPWPGWRDWRL